MSMAVFVLPAVGGINSIYRNHKKRWKKKVKKTAGKIIDFVLILFVKEFGLFTLQIFQTSFQVYD